MCVCVCVCVCVCARALSRSVESNSLQNPWTVTHQAPLSMGVSGRVYGSGFPFPSPKDLPDPGIKHSFPVSPALQADSLLLSY